MWKLVSGLVLALVAIGGCKQGKSLLDPALDPAAAPPPTKADPAHAPAPTAFEDRLARVERRLDRVVALLEQNLPPQAPSTAQLYAMPIDPIDPVIGPPDAKVTIAFVFELPCPACAQLDGVLDQLAAKYPKDVRVVGKYLPVHGTPSVMPGLVLCAAAKQGKYAAVKSALWRAITTPAFDAKQVAATAGADARQLEADLVACQQWLTKSQSTLRTLGTTATPAIFVNGRFAEGALTLPIVESMIGEAMTKATEAIASGVPQAEYYQREIVGKGARTVKSRFDD